MTRTTRRRRVAPVGNVPPYRPLRSDEWTSADPKVYVDRLRVLCTREAKFGWEDADLQLAFRMGMEARTDRPGLLHQLRDHCRARIRHELDHDATVLDYLLHIYNLTTRALETEASESRLRFKALQHGVVSHPGPVTP